MVVVALLSLMIVALMGVFNSTQTAFRASVTQTDVLEGGRNVMDIIAQDFRNMTPSLGVSNGPVNFYVGFYPNPNKFPYSGTYPNVIMPLIQPLVGSANGSSRTNVLESFFILSRNNRTWTGTGYTVGVLSTNFLFPLYRFSMSANISSANAPAVLFTNFWYSFPQYSIPQNSTNWSHLIDGVVDLRVRVFDPAGG